MKRILLGVLPLAAAVLFAGCARIDHHITYGMNKPVSFSQKLDQEYAFSRSFRESERQYYFLLHWFPINRANGIEMAQNNMRDDESGVINLRIRSAYDPLDYLITLVTAGLVTSYHVEAWGDAVRFTTPPVPAPQTAPTGPPAAP